MKSRAGNFTIKWDNDKSVYRASLNGKPTNFFANDLAAVQHMVERQIRTDEEEDPWGA
jgi:hypothetical protein